MLPLPCDKSPCAHDGRASATSALAEARARPGARGEASRSPGRDQAFAAPYVGRVRGCRPRLPRTHGQGSAAACLRLESGEPLVPRLSCVRLGRRYRLPSASLVPRPSAGRRRAATSHHGGGQEAGEEEGRVGGGDGGGAMPAVQQAREGDEHSAVHQHGREPADRDYQPGKRRQARLHLRLQLLVPHPGRARLCRQHARVQDDGPRCPGDGPRRVQRLRLRVRTAAVPAACARCRLRSTQPGDRPPRVSPGGWATAVSGSHPVAWCWCARASVLARRCRRAMHCGYSVVGGTRSRPDPHRTCGIDVGGVCGAQQVRADGLGQDVLHDG